MEKLGKEDGTVAEVQLGTGRGKERRSRGRGRWKENVGRKSQRDEKKGRKMRGGDERMIEVEKRRRKRKMWKAETEKRKRRKQEKMGRR